MKEFKNGLLTGLTLQLAIGPVFFFIINLSLQKTIFDGLAGALAVTLVDYIYISLAILGIGVFLNHHKVKKVFGVLSSMVLIIFGVLMFKSVIQEISSSASFDTTTDLFKSFASVFIISITSPMTIIFFTGLFTAKALEYNYTKKELALFGLGTGLATFLFMGLSAILFSQIKGIVPPIIVQILNGGVGCLLIVYGLLRLKKFLKRDLV